MSNIFCLPPDLREAIYHAWDPEKGISPDAIRTLLHRVDCTPAFIAQESGVTAHYVQHVIARIRRSPKVEATITRHLLGLGLSQDMIWGISAPRRPSIRMVPDGFDGVPAFAGRLVRAHHEIILLADCETSGPNAEIHRAVEAAFLQVVFDRRPEGGYRLLGTLGGYTGLQDPGAAPANPISMRTHGIPMEALIGRCFDRAKVRKLVETSSTVVAHNASFDRRFLCREFPCMEAKPWLCSYRGINWKGLGFSAANLRVLSEAQGLPVPGHRAPGDVSALYRLLDSRLPDGRTGLSHLVATPTLPLLTGGNGGM